VFNSKLEVFKELCEQFTEKTNEDAEGMLAHLNNVGYLLEEALKIADITRLEIHGPAIELAKLQEPLTHLKPQFFILEYSFRGNLYKCGLRYHYWKLA
jgi:hypothetical protein